MLKDVGFITKTLFNRQHPDEVDVNEIEQLISSHPYFAAARLLLAKKVYQINEPLSDNVVTAGLYVHNPLRLNWLLNQEEHAVETAVIEPEAEQKPQQQSSDNTVAFQSYHTIDYFASQGIRLQLADLGKDKLGQQLKSFTEWLRSMKKLPSSEAELPAGQEDQHRHQHVLQSAAHSIEAKEILTEAMAQVWLKQGNRDKAVSIYQKLSLQNPGKSNYFAAKIDELKAL